MSAVNADPKLIASLPPALLKTIPAGPPPPGIQPNFADPSTRVPVILSVIIPFLVLAVLCFSIRIYTKLAIARNWKWDDLTCSLGFICSIVYFVTVVERCINGAVGRHLWDVHMDLVLNNGSLYQAYISNIMVTPALGFIKLSLFIQYYQLFRTLRWLRICVWVGAPISAAFYVAVTITGFVLESPWPGESFLEAILSWHYAKFAEFSIPTGVTGMLVDWYLLILPIPAVLGLHMSTAKKLGVLIVFMTGSLAAVASTVSLYYRVHLGTGPSDPTWGVGYVLLWAQIEMFAGVAASSMPTVNQFCADRNVSLTSRISSFRSNLKHLLSSSTRPSRSAREKLPDHNPSFTGWSGSKTHTMKDREVTAQNCLKTFLSRATEEPDLLKTEDSQEYLAHQIGRKVYDFMLKSDEEVDIALSLAQLGLDSLMAVELRRWWKQALGLQISQLEIMATGSLMELGKIAAEGLQGKIVGTS